MKQKHGYWWFLDVMVSFGNYQQKMICSECEARFVGTGVTNEWKYCPNCGAKMDGEPE